ncbi:MAG: hypothetical protein N2578_03945, partial [Bdellovibrionaceae bacterium]|nr:hypothetical protein [Pseudobdellovibrionaceae bacterium]
DTLDACGLLRTPENLEELKRALRVQMKIRPQPYISITDGFGICSLAWVQQFPKTDPLGC